MKPSSQIPESANPDKESTQNAAGGNGSSACDTTARQGRKHRAVDQMYQYLLKRGVLLCTAQNHGAIFDENPTADRIRSRLNEDITYSGYPLSTLAKAILWLPMFQQEAGPSYVAKPFFKFFPHSNGEPPKFLFPTNSDALPFVARTVWDQRKKIEIPIVLTEGPVKTYAL